MGAAISLWHKIFGSPEQQSQKIADAERNLEEETIKRLEFERIRPREPRPELARPRDWEAETTGQFEGERMEFDETRVGETTEAARGDSESQQSERDSDVSERQNSRRRRRRGGRGRRSGREQSAGEGTERSAQRGPRDRNARGGQRNRRVDRSAQKPDDDPWGSDARVDQDEPDYLDDVMADDDDSLDEQLASAASETQLGLDESLDDTESESVSTATSSRNIPSWEAAIGMIVDINMQSRGERRQSAPRGSRPTRGGRSGRRRRGGGGRSRGSGGAENGSANE
jgi:hypothetical protein